LVTPLESDWLSLRISERSTIKKGSQGPLIYISVPKKTVRLATRRNYIKRLIKEALRTGNFIKDNDRTYSFRVMSVPEGLDFETVKRSLDRILK